MKLLSVVPLAILATIAVANPIPAEAATDGVDAFDITDGVDGVDGLDAVNIGVPTPAGELAWRCVTNARTYIVKDSTARQQAGAGGTSTNTKSGYPHVYGNFDNLKFNSRCLKPGVTLLEYPVYDYKEKKNWKRDVSKSDQAAPQPPRVVSTTDHNLFCGVMTHEHETNGRGDGGFKLCTITRV